ncbi:MAG: aminotransferase class V-fold PLP-dependent enzyme [Lachnospiraceae bacterium]|nr:aminotransferase class V-fold PLP-dependent enzyme [Lachnospiraceae bacterium]
MPGHKRNKNAGMMSDIYGYDITEIDGFDNLHDARGILLACEKKAANLYGAEETQFLINGSTAGILTAISASVQRGGTLLMARNCHRSAYHTAYLRQCKLVYLFPQEIDEYNISGAILPEDVACMLAQNERIEAVFITSPTYEGIVSDIREIAKIVHLHHKILIVDEAHGAHFGLDEEIPSSAIQCGADLVIQSTHKMLPAMTQTALLHINGNLVNRDLVHRFLKIYQTSSPSYILMASIDSCIDLLIEGRKSLFSLYTSKKKKFAEEMKQLSLIQIPDEEKLRNKYQIWEMDPCKIVISVKETNITGKQLYDLLRDNYHLQMEMAASTYVLAIMSIMDTQEGFDRLAGALLEIDKQLESKNDVEHQGCNYLKIENHISPKVVQNIDKALDAKAEWIPLSEAKGRIAADFIMVYPPGIPLIVPGEQIDRTIIKVIEDKIQKKLDVLGIERSKSADDNIEGTLVKVII